MITVTWKNTTSDFYHLSHMIGRADQRLHVHFTDDEEEGCFPIQGSPTASFNDTYKSPMLVIAGNYVTLGCPFVDGFEWTRCFYWNPSHPQRLRSLKLGSMCESPLKHRKLTLFFL